MFTLDSAIFAVLSKYSKQIITQTWIENAVPAVAFDHRVVWRSDCFPFRSLKFSHAHIHTMLTLYSNQSSGMQSHSAQTSSEKINVHNYSIICRTTQKEHWFIYNLVKRRFFTLFPFKLASALHPFLAESVTNAANINGILCSIRYGLLKTVILRTRNKTNKTNHSTTERCLF